MHRTRHCHRCDMGHVVVTWLQIRVQAVSRASAAGDELRVCAAALKGHFRDAALEGDHARKSLSHSLRQVLRKGPLLSRK